MEESNYAPKSDVDKELDQQREESEARSLINEVERLNTLEGEHLYRWIWELLQNARDEGKEGIEILCSLKENLFVFEHNGQPFSTGNLLALTRKTSTKPLDGAKGNAGKFGTGFVTSHLLNKTVTIQGIHVNLKGERHFELILDRNPEGLEEMMQSIRISLQRIREIDVIDAQTISNRQNCFSYRLSPTAKNIAASSLRQLKESLPFTMMVNPQIKKVILEHGDIQILSIKENKQAIEDISFVHLKDENREEQLSTGILFKNFGELKIASPVAFDGERYSLRPIGFRAHLFKELPLIGSEEFFLPVIMQHENFQPTEPRDGVRTKMSEETTNELLDPKAKKNRDCFREFTGIFPGYLDALIKAKVDNLHYLAESGFPPNLDLYYGRDWFQNEVQNPLREALISKAIVRTVEGDNICIDKAIFFFEETPFVSDFFDLVSAFLPDKCPDENSYIEWIKIINQQKEAWPSGILFSIEDLVAKLESEDILLRRFPIVADRITWLQKLILYLEMSTKERLAIEHNLYPNQANGLKNQNQVTHEGNLHPRFKSISKKFGRNLEEELLPVDFIANFVAEFNTKQFLLDLNKQIGDLSPADAEDGQIQAIVDICCTFKNSRAERREIWYGLISQLLPDLAGERFSIDFDEDYSWEPAERWALKYVCLLVENSIDVDQFFTRYFDGNTETGFLWLNELISFVFRNDENKDVGLKFAIFPTRDKIFRIYNEDLYKEDGNIDFDNEIKAIYTDFCGKGNPDTVLIHAGISNSNLRMAKIELLTDEIDGLFRDQASEEKVKENGAYKDLFLRLKKWIDENHNGAGLFPLFNEKKPILYIKAFGGNTFSRLLNLKKSADDLEILDKINLSALQIKALDEAVQIIGNANSLLQKAKELADEAEAIRWRKDVGDAAEDAFLEALSEACPTFPKPENPDDGKDFILRVQDKEYAIEIKSAVEFKETVNMSIKQGQTAVSENGSYALCVISRPQGQLTTKADFILNSKFVVTIGKDLEERMRNWEENLGRMDQQGDLSVKLESQKSAVYINKPVWTTGLGFYEFIAYIKTYFHIT